MPSNSTGSSSRERNRRRRLSRLPRRAGLTGSCAGRLVQDWGRSCSAGPARCCRPARSGWHRPPPQAACEVSYLRSRRPRRRGSTRPQSDSSRPRSLFGNCNVERVIQRLRTAGSWPQRPACRIFRWPRRTGAGRTCRPHRGKSRSHPRGPAPPGDRAYVVDGPSSTLGRAVPGRRRRQAAPPTGASSPGSSRTITATPR
jgi:hypothetical protein